MAQEEIKKIKVNDEEINVYFKGNKVNLEKEIAILKYSGRKLTGQIMALVSKIDKLEEKTDKMMQIIMSSFLQKEEEREEKKKETPKENSPKPSKKLIKIKSKFNANCNKCGKALRAGWTVYYCPDEKRVYCSGCKNELV